MRLSLICAAATLAVATGCSHAPTSSNSLNGEPRELLAQACQSGHTVKSVKGSVWLKAKSKEASGQFPAEVDAPSASRLKLEVTNLVGGTEAVLSIEGRHYKIEVPDHKDQNEQGESSWGGIPLQWANALFLGRFPCPDAVNLKGATVSRDATGGLVVEVPDTLGHLAEKYIYHFRPLDGGVWTNSLHWERKGIANSPPVIVDFKFEEPESKSRSPLKWEAKGSQGEVRVRWKDRRVEYISAPASPSGAAPNALPVSPGAASTSH